MPKVSVFNKEGNLLSELSLSEKIFGIKPNQQVLYDVVNKQRAAMRQGTHATKNRAAVSGGGRKPWAQKGTGNARHGSIRSPLWRGGGVAFGPQPRDYDFKINAKIKKLALYSAFSWQVKNNNLKIIESLDINITKTKEFAKMLKVLQLDQKVLIIVKELKDNLVKVTGNLSQVVLESVHHVSVYQILSNKMLLMTKEAVAYFEEVLK